VTMSKAPEPWNVSCNIEPRWLSEMASGVLGDIRFRHHLFVMMGGGLILPLPLVLSAGFAPPKLSLMARACRWLKSLFTF